MTNKKWALARLVSLEGSVEFYRNNGWRKGEGHDMHYFDTAQDAAAFAMENFPNQRTCLIHQEVPSPAAQLQTLRQAYEDAVPCSECTTHPNQIALDEAFEALTTFIEVRIAKWLRTTPRASGILLPVEISPHLARLADDIERGAHAKESP